MLFYTGDRPLRPKAELKDQHLHLLYCRNLACLSGTPLGIIWTRNILHVNFSFHGHLLTLHCPYSNYMKLWTGHTQQKLKSVSINEELGHSQLMRLPFYTLTRAVGCWYCCFYGLSFEYTLRLGQYNENGQCTKAASGNRT